MKIDRSNESILVIAITEAIQGALVYSFDWISLPQDWETNFSASLTEDFSKSLYKNLDEGGLSSFLYRFLQNKFHAKGYELPLDAKDVPFGGDPIPLMQYELFSDPLAMARSIVSELKKIPLQYELCCEVFVSMRGRAPEGVEIKISDRMRMVSSEIIQTKYKTKHDILPIDSILCSAGAKDTPSRMINPKSLYMLYRASGVLTDSFRPKIIADFNDDLRAFYGACFAFKVMTYYSPFKGDQNVVMMANEVDGGQRSFSFASVAEEDLRNAANVKSFFGTGFESFKSPESLSAVLVDVIKLFDAPESQRLKTASIWLLRSFLSERGMDKILDACISIEVLLGDRDASDRIGLSKLMANRSAYSLGRNARERIELSDFFVKFYKLRSDIVHSGRLKISKEETEVVDKGVELAARILAHETRMQ